MAGKDVIKQAIVTEMENGIIRKQQFPMLTQHGIRDYSETVHTAGLNYITQIGRSVEGIVALSECPVCSVEEELFKLTREVRSDSIWFDRNLLEPVLVAEFERYEKRRAKNLKLQEKIENLLIEYHRLGGKIPFILFVYWTYNDGTVAGDIERYVRVFDDGFKLSNGKWMPGINALTTEYLVYQAIALGTKEKLLIYRWIRVK